MENIWSVSREEEKYPKRLLSIPSPPKKLYVIGELPKDTIPTVALIGARDCSEYGKFIAVELGKALGKAQIQVISGMARGIDGIGQRATLDFGGKSYGILGCGVDICYPATNRDLYERLKVQGGLISEFAPGVSAKPQHFPARNRIVSGLADVVVVIEARQKSGTLITVDMALEQGKEVYAVPGRISDRLSDGCNYLIKSGAGVMLDIQEFIDEVYLVFEQKREYREEPESKKQEERSMPKPKEESKRGVESDVDVDGRETKDGKKKELGILCPEKMNGLTEEMTSIYKALDFNPKSIAEIKQGMDIVLEDKQIITYLMQLSLENLAIQVSPGKFCIRGN